MLSAKAAGSLTVAEVEAVQLFASVTITVYVPATTFVKSSFDDPLFQEKV